MAVRHADSWAYARELARSPFRRSSARSRHATTATSTLARTARRSSTCSGPASCPTACTCSTSPRRRSRRCASSPSSDAREVGRGRGAQCDHRDALADPDGVSRARTICSFDRAPIEPVAMSDLEHVTITRDFLNDPASYLRRLDEPVPARPGRLLDLPRRARPGTEILLIRRAPGRILPGLWQCVSGSLEAASGSPRAPFASSSRRPASPARHQAFYDLDLVNQFHEPRYDAVVTAAVFAVRVARGRRAAPLARARRRPLARRSTRPIARSSGPATGPPSSGSATTCPTRSGPPGSS